MLFMSANLAKSASEASAPILVYALLVISVIAAIHTLRIALSNEDWLGVFVSSLLFTTVYWLVAYWL